MATLLLEDFDGYGGDGTQFSRRWSGGNQLSSAHAKTGSWSLGNGVGTTFSTPVSPATNVVIVGCWVYWSGTPPVFDAIHFLASGTTPNGFNEKVGLTFDSSHRIVVRAGNFTTLATSAACLNTGAWNYVAAKFTVDNSGSYEVFCNGTSVLSGSGDTDSGSHTVTAIVVTPDGGLYFDSLWLFDSSGSVNNDFPAGTRIVTGFLPSTGNGATTGLTPSSGSDHGALVDEAIANDDTDYNSGTAGQKDTYSVDTSSLAGRTIDAVQLTACIKPTGAGTNQYAGVVRIAGTDYAGTTKTIPGTSYVNSDQLWDVRPSDSAAWTPGDLTEFGGNVVAAASAIRLTRVYLSVLTDEPAAGYAVSLVNSTPLRGGLVGGGRLVG